MQAKEMIESFYKTSCMSVLKLLLDDNDPQLPEYLKILKDFPNVLYSIGMQKPVTILINDCWNLVKNSSIQDNVRWLSVTNDDFVYRTNTWDLTMISELRLHGGYGISYGNDLLQGVNMPTTSIVSREIVEELGWLQMPSLTHLFGDNVWQTIGVNCNCLFYHPGIIIEHKHYFAKKALQDEIYLKTNSRAMYDVDQLAFTNWVMNQARMDIRKVKSLLEKLHASTNYVLPKI